MLENKTKKPYKEKKFFTYFVSGGFTTEVDDKVQSWLNTIHASYDEVELINSSVGVAPGGNNFRYKDISVYAYKY